jgi:prepilin peptidase CpaA
MSLNWWSIFVVLAIATVWDIAQRRIPNWLVVPFLAAGLAWSGWHQGVKGLELSLGGMAVAALMVGPMCWLGGMGMGDLKLCAGIGAWIGPGQLFFALIMTAIAGGIIGVGYAIAHRSLGRSLNTTGDLVASRFRGAPRHLASLDNAAGLSIPYAPAIAVGTIFAFFASRG